MSKEILFKPLITERATRLQEKRSQYVFVVNKDANKSEISSAIEKRYSVKVASVNTLIMPAKAKSRNTKTAVVRGRRSAYKKAFITLVSGDVIDTMGVVGE
jgi:large subunit ribosomal protein L23